jgi:hypothetical protein
MCKPDPIKNCEHPLHNRMKGNQCGSCGEYLFADLDPILEERVRASMIIAARIDDYLKAKKLSLDDFHRQCNALIPKGESNYGPRRIRNWVSGTHDFKVSELIVIEKVLNEKFIKYER